MESVCCPLWIHPINRFRNICYRKIRPVRISLPPNRMNSGFKFNIKTAYMKLKRTIWAFMACCMTVWSCMKEDIVLPEAGHTGEISFSLDYRGYEGIRETKSTAADYDRVEFAVVDSDGKRVRDLKGYYDKRSSAIRIEGLRSGAYRLLVLGMKGDWLSDRVETHDIDDLTDVWISFPEDLGKPLSAEYFHSSTPFHVTAADTPSGTVYDTDVSGQITQKRIVGRVDFSFAFRKADIEASVLSNTVTIHSPGFCTGMSADGTFSGRTDPEAYVIDMSEGRTCHFLPTAESSDGTVEMHTRDYRGNTIRRNYGFIISPVSPNHIYSMEVDVVHPEDKTGTLFVTETFYKSGGHGKILQDDEPHTIYTDKTLRNFNTAKPLQVSVLPDGQLHVRFYSPREVAGVLIKAKIPSVSDSFFDLAYFDRIPAFADFHEDLPLTAEKALYRTDEGSIVEIPRMAPEDLSEIEFRIESKDPYWAKLEQIIHGWNIRFDLFGGDPTLPDGGPQGNWMGIRPVHCREAVAFFLNFTYMIDMPEHERILRDNQDRLYGNGGVDDKVSVETVLSQMRQTRTINVGLVYPGNGVVGLGGGSTFGAYQPGWTSHYTSLYSCEIMFHELGHVMGYSHSSSFTYGPWAQELMNHFYVEHLAEMPVDSPEYLQSSNNPNLYK